MLYMGYLIIVNGQNIKKIGFGNFHFGASEVGKLQQQVVCPSPFGSPRPPPNTQRG